MYNIIQMFIYIQQDDSCVLINYGDRYFVIYDCIHYTQGVLKEIEKKYSTNWHCSVVYKIKVRIKQNS